jgi:hypothetical protein
MRRRRPPLAVDVDRVDLRGRERAGWGLRKAQDLPLIELTPEDDRQREQAAKRSELGFGASIG